MSNTTRANSMFTLPGVSQYTRTNSLTTVVDNIELDDNGEIKENKRETNPGIPQKLDHESVLRKNKKTSICDLEVQLMMKDKMIEELLEENGKLIENMNKLEQDRLDEQNRIQQGTEMVIQQIVEDNEWYKSQFLEMKNELEKAISQTRNKGREISTMEKRCRTLIEEKETIQHFLDELTLQYDKRVGQLQTYKNNTMKMMKLINQFIGINKKYHKENDCSSLNELTQKIREIICGESGMNNIERILTQIQLNAKRFEVEVNEIYENIQKGSQKDTNSPTGKSNPCDCGAQTDYNSLEKVLQSDNVNDESTLDHSEKANVVTQKTLNKGYENISLKNKYKKVMNELENCRHEIEKLKYEIKRKSEIIRELKSLNRENNEILDNINNQKENKQIKLLNTKIEKLESEKRELIQKIARLNLAGQGNKLLIHKEDAFDLNIDDTETYNNAVNDRTSSSLVVGEYFNEQSDSLCSSQPDDHEPLNLNSEHHQEYGDSDKEDGKSVSYISKIVDKYIKYPVDYAEKKQMILRNSVQRNRYF